MNNRGEGRSRKLAGDFTVLLAVAVIVGTFSTVWRSFIGRKTRHRSGCTIRYRTILTLGIRSVPLSLIKALSERARIRS